MASEFFMAGHEHYKRREPIAAIRYFNDALRLQPDHFWSQCLSAICWLQLKRQAEAGAGLNACLKRDPEFAWLYILRGYASSIIPANAEPEEVAIRYEAADADYRRAMELLDRRPNDELRYVLLVDRGLLQYQRGDLEDATSYLTAAIQQNDRPSQAHAELAMVYKKQGKFDEAADRLSRAIERRRDYAPLYRARAELALARKALTDSQRAAALSDLDHAIRLESPGNSVLARDQTNRGRLLTLDHREAEALAAYDAAIKISGDSDDAHRLRIELLLRSKRHNDVIRSCDALIARGKASSAIYEVRSLARAELKDFPGAIEDVTNAVATRRDRSPLLSRRGWLYILSDAPRLALHDFQEAIRLDPSSGDAHNGRGSARLRLGEHRQAVTDAEKALVLGKPSPDLYYKAARVYAVAAVAAAAEVRKKGQDTAALVAMYQDRAAVLLHETLRLMPADQRASFRRDVIQSDPALKMLLRRVSSLELAGPVPSAATPANKPGQ
jgi:tetratricopeptide (TPR) repeat protein